jgi:hypothetical protein
MSETDDIFDIDDFLKKKKAPAYIQKVWDKHLRYLNECEQAAEKGLEITQALRTIKTALEKIK